MRVVSSLVLVAFCVSALPSLAFEQGAERAFRHVRVISGTYDDFTPVKRSTARDGGLTINVEYDSNLATHPRLADIKATVNSVLDFYKANFSNPISVNVLLQDMSSGLGQNLTQQGLLTYAKFREALAAHATTADDALALSKLPQDSANPVNGSSKMALTHANMRALGFSAGGRAGSRDSILGINISLTNITAAENDPTKSSLAAVMYHELDEVLGTVSSLYSRSNPTGPVCPTDLFRYHNDGSRSYSTDPNEESYFSIDGSDLLVRYNQLANGDYGDFFVSDTAQSVPHVQDFRAPRGKNPIPNVELRILDVVGFDFVGTSLPNLAFDAAAQLNAPAQITPGNSLSVSSTIFNSGIAPAGAFVVRFLISKDRVPDAADTVLGEVAISGLVTGASAPVQWSGNCPKLPLGHYYILAVCDAASSVTELNESDNIIYRSTEVEGTGNKDPLFSSPPTFAPNPASSNVALTFTAAATDADGDLITYAWDFGDGSTGGGASTTHTYVSGGTYTVKCTASDEFGGSVTSTISVPVSTSVVKAIATKKKFSINFNSSVGALDITLSSSDLKKPITDGSFVSIYIGDVTTKGAARTLDSAAIFRGKGSGVLNSGKFTFSTTQGTVRYATTLSGFDKLLSPFGATQSAVAPVVTIPIYVFVNNEFIGDNLVFNYTVSSNGSGKGN